MPISQTSAVERIARVLAGQRLSVNAGGDEDHAASAVDSEWEDHVSDALAILHTLREPDEEMAKAGDPEVWQRMIAAVIDPPKSGF